MSVFFLCLLGHYCAYSQREVEYLKTHGVEISIDSADEDFTDLVPLKAFFGNARIVLLGEQSHGDGTTFSTKIRLIKFLHDRLGFEVLAFENGIFDSFLASDRISAGDGVAATLRATLYPLWSHTEELRPLSEYIEQSRSSSSQIIIAGFDPQLPAQAKIRQEVLHSFFAYLRTNGRSLGDWAEEENFINHWYALESRGNQDFITGKLDHPLFIKTLTRVINELTNGTQRDDIKWNSLFRSMAAYMPALIKQSKALSALAGSKTDIDLLRDSVMAANLICLARDVYPNKKIIVWAASWHIARGEGKMGYFLQKYSRERMYSIAFTAAYGHKRDFITNKIEPLPQISPDSFEDLFVRSGFQNVFLDLSTTSKTKNGKWLMDMRVMRPFGYRDVNNRWPISFDGIIFNREMHPSHMIAE